MRIEQLSYFISVVEHGSINKAAQYLYVSQPTLSSAIISLEKEIGVNLLIRSNNGIVLTKYGEIVYKDAKQIMANVEKWRQFKNENIVAKQVDFFSPELPAINIFPNIFKTFWSDYPDINLNFISIDNIGSVNYISSIEEAILKYDIILHIEGPYKDSLSVNLPSWLTSEIMYSDLYCLYMNKNHTLADKNEITLDDISDTNISLSPYSFLQKHLSLLLPSNKIRYFSTQTTLVMLSENSDILTILPSYRFFSVNSAINSNIVVKPFADQRFYSHHFLFYPNKETINEETQIFVNLIRDAYCKFNQKTIAFRQSLYPDYSF